MNILDSYCGEFPAPANAISIFAGEWASNVPNAGGGTAALFADSRLEEIITLCGGLDGKKCLELGPLEGGHTYMMWQRGAASILSIEANQRAFLKCLITKEIVGHNGKVLLGDFVKYVEAADEKYDFVNMSGVLYHMVEPHRLIENVARLTDQVACWTHYFDPAVLAANELLRDRFSYTPQMVTAAGLEVSLHQQRYLEALQTLNFCGGKEEVSYWLPKADILGLFDASGFDVHVLNDTPTHPNGPCMNFYAIRR